MICFIYDLHHEHHDRNACLRSLRSFAVNTLIC
jgi:hypothetical protein